MTQTKICTKCNIEKSIIEFAKQKHGKYRVTSHCKKCKSQYYQDNKEIRAECGKKYRQANKENIADKKKQYYQDNKEQISEQQKQYHQANKQKITERQKQYNEVNKELKFERNKEYYQTNKQKIAKFRQENKERITTKKKQYRQANQEKIAEYGKQYRQTSVGKAVSRATRQNRRAQKLQNGGKHTGKQILALFDQQSGVCPYCKAKLHKSRNNKYHVDHIMPLSKGGSNDISNIQLLCPTCNLSKGNKSPEEFSQYFGMLI